MDTAVTLVSRFNPGIGIGTYTQSLYAALRWQQPAAATLFHVEVPRRRSSEVLAPLWVWWRLGGHRAQLYHADYTDTALGLLLRGRHPLVVTIHDDIPFRYPSDRHPLWRLAYRLGFKLLKRKCDAIITVSEHSKRDLLQHGLDPEKIFVVYNGVDRRRFFPVPRSRDHQPIVIGYLASLARRKRVDRLLQAYALLRQQTTGIRLVIGGTGPLLGELRQLAEQLELKDVEFRGFVPEEGLNEFYNELDIFAFPSDYEGFGLPLLEAMACRVPVVATRLSCHPEIVGDAGVLVEPDPQSLANGVMRLVADPGLRRDVAERGYIRSERFTWERCAEETLAVYHKVMTPPAGDHASGSMER
jgi:glycosyltransferase involved in cell wall biosynthesis